MRFTLASVLLASVALTAASCDSTPPDSPPPASWALAECPPQSGKSFLFIGQEVIVCHHDDTLLVDGLDSLLFIGGNVDLQSNGEDKLMVLRDFRHAAAAYRLHLPSGEVARLSTAGTQESQIDEGVPGTFIISDIPAASLESDNGTIVYTEYRGRILTPIGAVTVPEVGQLVPLDSDFHPETGMMAHLMIARALNQYVLVLVDTRALDVVWSGPIVDVGTPQSIVFLDDGPLLLLDYVSGEIYTVAEDGHLARIAGLGTDNERLRRILPFDGDRVLTYTSDENSTQIVTVDGEGQVETLATVSQQTRYLALSASEQTVCGREFPFYGSEGEEYIDQVYSYDLGGEVSRHVVSLDRDKFTLPFFACF